MNKIRYDLSKKTPKSLKKRISAILITICLLAFKDIQAQPYYPGQQFPSQVQVPPPGIVGTLYNSFPYQILNAQTVYYGPQNLYGMIYLPYIQEEYQGEVIIPMPLIPPYTSGIALSALKAPALGLYAPTEVVSHYKKNLFELTQIYPFATTLPLDDNMLTYKGPFNVLPHLNQKSLGFFHPHSTESGISVLEAVQKFTKFTHDMFPDDPSNPLSDGWNGFDKAGDICITSMVSYSLKTGFYFGEQFESGMYMGFNVASPTYPLISRDVVGHEASHGILFGALGVPISGDKILDDEITVNPSVHPEMDALSESFCDIMGISFDNWHRPLKFEMPNWILGIYQKNSVKAAYRPFHNPKSQMHPTTYNGEFYKQDPFQEDYNPHHNGQVMNFWFYLLNEGKSGDIDDVPGLPYTVYPLIPNNRTATYKLALQMIFKVFTERLNYQSTFDDVRKASLEIIQEMGHPIGSHAYVQVWNAWYAVGVGNEKWNPGAHHPSCTTGKSGDSWFNGFVSFNAMKAMLTDDLSGAPMYMLNDCTVQPGILTRLYNPVNGLLQTALDGDNNQIFHPENDLSLSKSAISVHWGNSLASTWFHNTFNYLGLDEVGSFPIESVLGHPDHAFRYPKFNPDDQVFYYDLNEESFVLDEISRQYFFGIHYLLKGNTNKYNDLDHPEWEAILNGLGNIFSLNIKENYKASLPGVYIPGWTLGEELNSNPGVNYMRSFSNPGLYGQAGLYKGIHWNENYPSKNASLLNFWYYLLVQGTESYGPQGFVNEKGHPYFVFAQQKDIVLEIIWKAYREIMPVFGNFEEFRLATLKVAEQSYGYKSKPYIAFYDAWSAVMDYPDFASTLAHVPADGEVVYPWPVEIGIQSEYPLYESSRVFEVSENPAFEDQLSPVWRFKNHSAPSLETGMVYGQVTLELDKTYYVRSHLTGSGELLKGGCAASDDPVFCEALKGKQKWTAPFKIFTSKVPPPTGLSPAQGSLAPAWQTPFSWQGVLNANGYYLKVSDDSGLVPMQTMEDQTGYDPDIPLVNKTLSLSRDKQYSWSVAGKQKTGSAQAVRRVVDPLSGQVSYVLLTPDIPLTPAEQALFKDISGSFTETISFKTDLPKVVLGDYADGTKVSMIGNKSVKALQWDNRGDFFRFDFFLNGDFKEPKWTKDFVDEPVASKITLNSSDFLLDGHHLGWTFTPWMKAVAPFILQDEPGETHQPFHFILEKDLIPQPVLNTFSCVLDKIPVILTWDAVEGAQWYEYALKDLSTQTVVASGKTNLLQAGPFDGALSPFPAMYEWQVAAGVKDMNGNWAFGTAAKSTYKVAPEEPLELLPSGFQLVELGPNASVNFSWKGNPKVSTYLFSLFKVAQNGDMVKVVENQTVNGTSVKIENLDFGATYNWSVSAKVDGMNCRSINNADFKTKEEPFEPELGFNFTLVDCDKLGFCLPDIKYNITVTAPNNSTVFTSSGLFSNTAGISYSPNSSGATNGELPIMNGTYTVTVQLVQIGAGVSSQPSKPAWLFSAHSMDIFPLLNGLGAAIELDKVSKLNQVNPTQNAIIKIKFNYNTSSNQIQTF